ncbi:hypothetical protein BC833DRAFT_600441 [Globomyces pollinis-pini]|nr:hypothetical protein BC833DRAFT_600441 [Globomyces pollinis-pini]
MLKSVLTVNHFGIYIHYLFINLPWSFFTFAFTVSAISVSIPFILLFPIGFVMFSLSCIFIKLFGKVEVFLYNLYDVPNLFHQLYDEERLSLMHSDVPYQPIPSSDLTEPCACSQTPPSTCPHCFPHERQLNSPDDYLPQPELGPIISVQPQCCGILHHINRAVSKDIFSEESLNEIWSLIAYFTLYKLPSSTVMFTLTAFLFIPLLNYFELQLFLGLFQQFCSLFSVSTTMGYLIWIGLCIPILPCVMLICCHVYTLEQRFLKTITFGYLTKNLKIGD